MSHLVPFRMPSRVFFALHVGAALGCGSPVRDYAELPTDESPLLAEPNSLLEQPTDAEGAEASTSGSGPLAISPVGTTSPIANNAVTGAVTNGMMTEPSSTGPNLSSTTPDPVAAPARCGDTRVDVGETCDEGASNSDSEPNACRTTCTLPRCGDGVQDDTEDCDDGNALDNDDCTNNCTRPDCGDAIVQEGEACDDGNTTDEDDCSNSCTVPGCGDGIVQPAREECDDGGKNTTVCTVACRYPKCGDNFVQGSEECDDGNLINDDTCSAICRRPSCGDGVVSIGESCEDGNTNSGDGCSSTCQVEVCGDGILSIGESCEDGNTVAGDGCSDTCQTEVCGDSNKTGIEQCDDGNHFDNDGCSSTCRNEVCGDGVVQTPREECEDLNTVDTDVCRNGCKHAASLNYLSNSCANTDQITQTVCMVATANWCKQYNNSPIAGMVTGKEADNEYTVGCIGGFAREEASTSQLSQCQPGRQQSPACLDQVETACSGLGYSQGFYLGTGSSGNYAIACGSGALKTENVPGCNGISDTSPVPVGCAQALAAKCGKNKGGMLQALAQTSQVTYACIELTLTGTVRQF